VETALKNVGSIPQSRPLPLSGDQNVFDHSRYLTHENGLLKNTLNLSGTWDFGQSPLKWSYHFKQDRDWRHSVRQ